MKKSIIFFAFLISCYSSFGQIKYYVATGKDSITYLATNIGLLVLTRGYDQKLTFNTMVSDSNKEYIKALDNDNYLILSTTQSVDLYSLSNKFYPQYVGSLGIPDIISFRPFGNYFAILRGHLWNEQELGKVDHYIVGVEQDTFKILTSITALQFNYTNRTEFYPEVVYPYFFSLDSTDYPDYTSKLIMYKFIDLNKSFVFIDTLDVVTPGYRLVQIYGAKDRLYIRENYSSGSNYTIHAKKYLVNNDTLYFISQSNYNSPIGFIDEIECTDTLIRLNGNYTYLDGTQLHEPNGDLFSYPNLSGIRIYNTVQWGVPNFTEMYYSTYIEGTDINSAQFIYEPNGIEESRKLKGFILYENYPNPFNPTTKIRYSIEQSGPVTLKIMNILGREIQTPVNGYKSSGTYEISWNADNLPAGVYFYQLRAGNFVETKKMVLVK